mgnify:CR=1 FL=1
MKKIVFRWIVFLTLPSIVLVTYVLSTRVGVKSYEIEFLIMLGLFLGIIIGGVYEGIRIIKLKK